MRASLEWDWCGPWLVFNWDGWVGFEPDEAVEIPDDLAERYQAAARELNDAREAIVMHVKESGQPFEEAP